jgi:Ca2+-binding RTX toxin-like protein
MRLRFLIGVLGCFAVVLALAVFPVFAGATTTCGIKGTRGDDFLRGNGGNNVICGYGGNDIIDGEGGADVIYGGPGNDTIFGGAGRDTIYAGYGNDVMYLYDGRRDYGYGGPNFDRVPRRDKTLDVVRRVESFH